MDGVHAIDASIAGYGPGQSHGVSNMPVCCVVGVGEKGVGEHVAKKFASEGAIALQSTTCIVHVATQTDIILGSHARTPKAKF